MIPPVSRQMTRDGCLLVLGACLYTLAFPPYEWSGLAWLTLTPLFLVLRGKTPRAGFLAGLLFGTLSACGIVFWVYSAVATFFALGFVLDALGALFTYAFFGGVPIGLAAALSCQLMGGSHTVGQGHPGSSRCWLGVPAVWVSIEYARSSLLPGFSWGILGYSQAHHLHLIQIADVTSVYGLSFLIGLSGYLIADLLSALHRIHASSFTRNALRAFPWPGLSALVIGVVFTVSYGAIRLRQYEIPPHARPVTIALARGDIPSEQRWQRMFHGSTLLTYAALTRHGVKGTRPDLVVWPEFALGFYLDQEPRLRAQLVWLAQELNTALLIGAPRMVTHETGMHYYNSAYFLTPKQGLVDVYDKLRLVPFAEYRPLALPALVPHTAERPREFTPGTRPTVFPLAQGGFGALICYEVTYPSLARRLVRNGARFLVNISNDTWLRTGGNAALTQHFAMAIFRAVETKRFLARVATGGISGFVDPLGRPFHLSTADG